MTVSVRPIDDRHIEVECGGQSVVIELPDPNGNSSGAAQPRSSGGGLPGVSGGPVVLGPLQPGSAVAHMREDKKGEERGAIVHMGAADYGDINIAVEKFAQIFRDLNEGTKTKEVRLDWLSEDMLDVDKVRGMVSPHIATSDFKFVVVARGKLGDI